MDLALILSHPPPLDPAWLAHEEAEGLLIPRPVITDPFEQQNNYNTAGSARNKTLLKGRDKHLLEGVTVVDFDIKRPLEGTTGETSIGIRKYSSKTLPQTSPQPGNLHELHTSEEASNKNNPCPAIIYYHGGGLYVGNLDSEDLTCRRISLALSCTVYSIDYSLMPQYTADDSLADALYAFQHITNLMKQSLEQGPLILVGSSSGGQLVAQVSQIHRREKGEEGGRIDGVLLRGPVTCDATEYGKNLPTQFQTLHKSMSPEFHTSLLSDPALNEKNRTKGKLPLEEEDLKGMPRHWIQVCTNDIYHSDGVCYAEALRLQGVEVGLDVVVGWPHTFWLKAPLLERAVQAEEDMIVGLKWLVDRTVIETYDRPWRE